jgi:hypothetical protein
LASLPFVSKPSKARDVDSLGRWLRRWVFWPTLGLIHPLTTEELAEIVGDPRALSKEMRQASNDARLLEARWDDLVKRHKDKWVGVQRREFLFASTLEDLIAEARAKGWDVGTMVVDCLADKRPALLL